MQNRMIIRVMLMLGLAVLVCGVAGDVLAEGKPGDAGLTSLRIGVGAREAGMGGAGVASSNDAAALYWNPANLAFEDFGTKFLLQHQRYLDLFDKEAASLAHRTPIGVIGLFFTGFYSDEIERYGEEPVGVPEGTFEPYDVVLGVSFARQFSERVALGMMVKMLHQEIDVYSDTGFAVDLFLSHKAVIEGLLFGASVTNLGGQMNLNEGPFDLPRTIRFGAAYTPVHPLFAGKVTAAADVVMPNDGTEKAHVGAEWRIIPELALRAGSKLNYNSQGLTFGVGLRRGPMDVSFAYEEMTNDLDESYKFALQLHY